MEIKLNGFDLARIGLAALVIIMAIPILVFAFKLFDIHDNPDAFGLGISVSGLALSTIVIGVDLIYRTLSDKDTKKIKEMLEGILTEIRNNKVNSDFLNFRSGRHIALHPSQFSGIIAHPGPILTASSKRVSRAQRLYRSPENRSRKKRRGVTPLTY